MQSQVTYMPLLDDAVGQSLSTRPDIIGTEISKVSMARSPDSPHIFVLCLDVESQFQGQKVMCSLLWT